MSRTITAIGFVVLLALGLVGALSNASSNGDRFGEPPEQLIQFDEQATAAFNEDAATRQNRNLVLVVVAITLGLTGVIVVGVGYLDDASNRDG